MSGAAVNTAYGARARDDSTRCGMRERAFVYGAARTRLRRARGTLMMRVRVEYASCVRVAQRDDRCAHDAAL